jgi:hypothetical protein
MTKEAAPNERNNNPTMPNLIPDYDIVIATTRMLMIVALLRMGPLFGGISALLERKKCPPTRL